MDEAQERLINKSKTEQPPANGVAALFMCVFFKKGTRHIRVSAFGLSDTFGISDNPRLLSFFGQAPQRFGGIVDFLQRIEAGEAEADHADFLCSERLMDERGAMGAGPNRNPVIHEERITEVAGIPTLKIDGNDRSPCR